LGICRHPRTDRPLRRIRLPRHRIHPIIGLALMVAGRTGHAIGGRRHYY